MLALIDGDIVRYRTGFASNDVPEGIACSRANETIELILYATGATEYKVFLSDSKQNNFRYQIYPGYKLTREKQPKPRHHEALGLFLKQEWGAEVAAGQEADDALGIAQSSSLHEEEVTHGWTPDAWQPTIICSIDKDLLQVPGRHYNWVKNEFYEQTYDEGLRSFFIQCLTGDRTDDVSGIQGIGPVKAKRALAGCTTPGEMFEVVRTMWSNDEALLRTGQVLWVRRKEGEIWQFPESTTQDTTHQSLSSSEKPRENGHSSAHGTLEQSGVPQRGSQTDSISETSSQD